MQIERKYAIGFVSEWDVVAVRDMVRDAHRVVMVAHTNADGDAVGSVTGMYQLLCQIGVAMVTPMLPNGVPDELSWLPCADMVVGGEKDASLCREAIGGSRPHHRTRHQWLRPHRPTGNLATGVTGAQTAGGPP